MGGALRDEVQRRYGFTAPDPFDEAAFTGPGGGFWLATDEGRPVGSSAALLHQGRVRPIAPFGRWLGDDTARCFEKVIVPP